MSIYKPVRIHNTSKRIPMVFDRLGYLSALAKGKSVLHVGCADYPMTEQRIRNGQLLHARLHETAKYLMGVDISREGVQVLRDRGYSNVVLMDAEELATDQNFDLVLAGDTLEHMSNPGRFVQAARNALSEDGELVIAVPSAFSFNVVRVWLRGPELTHKDHTAFYSPKTLAELCGRFGFVPTGLVFTVQPPDEGETRLFVFTRSCILRMFKTMAPSIIMHFQKKDSVELDQHFEWN